MTNKTHQMPAFSIAGTVRSEVDCPVIPHHDSAWIGHDQQGLDIELRSREVEQTSELTGIIE